MVAEVSDRLRAADRFEPGRLPFDFAVVTGHGVPRSLVMCLSHLAMDAATIRVLLDHGFAPPVDVHPRDPWNVKPDLIRPGTSPRYLGHPRKGS